MGVRTQDHLAAACQHFTGKLVDNSLMRRYIDTAVLLGAGKTEHVVIFVDRTANRAKRVVAVGQNIRYREFFQTRGTGCLDDTDESNIMRSQLIELDLQLLHVIGGIVIFQNTIRNCLLLGFFLRNGLTGLAGDRGRRFLVIRNNFSSTQKICAGIK